jgi:oligopeptide/dipeptide ABC transporter ATP-binding protein
MSALLSAEGLSVRYRTPAGPASVVDRVDLSIAPGEIFGLVGESGCGKTTFALAAMGLLPADAETSGRVVFDGRDLLALDDEELRRLRGDRISMIFQDPLTSLDPTFPVGAQIAEAILVHRDVTRDGARRRAIELLESVGIPDAASRYRDPPHRFSGGMRQRVVIAIALANEPALVLADEPTTALDVRVQAQILALLRRRCDEHGTAVLLVTHDLGVVAEVCDRVAVMYAGRVVETGPAAAVLSSPAHPYTKALLAALPARTRQRGALEVIAGEIPDLVTPPPGCRFAPRCPVAHERCSDVPAMTALGDGHHGACWLLDGGPARAAASPVEEDGS